jgi:DNA mismatch repair protein MLH1
MILARRDMLAEYFSLNISESGLVQSIPLLLRDFVPNLDYLPMFLMRLGPQVCRFYALQTSADLDHR